MSLALLEDAAD
jgi:hypothetical protein